VQNTLPREAENMSRVTARLLSVAVADIVGVFCSWVEENGSTNATASYVAIGFNDFLILKFLFPTKK